MYRVVHPSITTLITSHFESKMLATKNVLLHKEMLGWWYSSTSCLFL